MRITILNSYSRGGAAKAALRLHQGLRSSGIESTFICSDLKNNDGNIRKIDVQSLSNPILKRIALRLRLVSPGDINDTPKTKIFEQFELFSDCRSAAGKNILGFLPEADILNLHWIARFVDLPSLIKRFKGKIPIVWTLHDMQPFTGGCHYDNGCGNFKNKCGACPQLLMAGPRDASHEILLKRLRALDSLENSQLQIVTPSRWLAEQAKSSAAFSRFQVTVIPYGVDTTVFQPIEKEAAREVLGLPKHKMLLLFVAESLANPRKGLRVLLEALNNCSLSSPQPFDLLTIGRSRISGPIPSGIKIHSLGSIADERLLAIAYSTADLFIIPSLEDNLPNTLLESIACGTPIVGFPIGGIPDVVRPGQSGWLADSVTPHSLALAISTATQTLSCDEEKIAFQKNCRELAVSEYSLNVQANNYLSLFTKLRLQATNQRCALPVNKQ
jgi:glycosyltransferase involved in cell wall biosynthesis